MSTPLGNEIDRLRAENAELKRQLAKLEPVAFVSDVYQSRYTLEWNGVVYPEGTKLYTAPPVAQGYVRVRKELLVAVLDNANGGIGDWQPIEQEITAALAAAKEKR